MSKILVTGANGFVGRQVVRDLGMREHEVVQAVRHAAGPSEVAVGDLSGATDWRAALAGCNAVIHLAARVHVMQDQSKDALAEFRKVNVVASVELARQAIEAGINRFVYVSSVKVNGESTMDKAYTPFDPPAPQDPYGISKLEAEKALRALTKDSEMGLVVVRPPLVYGPGVRANFLRLIKLVGSGVPLPFGALRNKRSMVSVGNFSDLLIACATHPAAAGEVFLVSDDSDASTPELIRGIGEAFEKKPRLLSIPEVLLKFGGQLLGASGAMDRLLGSLQVDISHTKQTLGWKPVETQQQAIAATVSAFLASRKNRQP
ncbi:MAG: wcaG [Herminiimonas sp.]|nr:wcaG [Herminiimonas sp.]